jgi:hypothetical protein
MAARVAAALAIVVVAAHQPPFGSIGSFSSSSAHGEPKHLCTRKDVLAAIRNLADPEAATTQLLQISTAAQAKGNPACATKTSPNYCRACSMVAVNGLLAALDKVKDEMWADQKHLSAQASNVCSAASPADRVGGAGKCCFVMAGTGEFVPPGFAKCRGGTFKAVPAPVAARLAHHPTTGYHYVGGANAVIDDCCSTTSRCRTNDAALHERVAAVVVKLNSFQATMSELKLKQDQTRVAIDQAVTTLGRVHIEIEDICGVDIDTSPAFPTTTAEAATACTGGKIGTVVDLRNRLAFEFAKQSQAIAGANSAVGKATAWLLGENTSGAAAEIALLRRAGKRSNDTIVGAAFKRAAQLLEIGGRTSTKLPDVLNQIRNKVTVMQKKIAGLRDQHLAHGSALKKLVAQIGVLEKQSTSSTAQVAALRKNASGYAAAVDDGTRDKETLMSGFRLKDQEREMNAKQCTNFMRFYDSASLMTTEQLLVLEQIIKNIQQISC